MEKININLSEPTFIPIQTISDDRGLLIPFTDYIDKNLINRSYIVENYGAGIIRGLHYHLKEFKIFTIVSGAGKFITFKLPLDMAQRNDENEIIKFAKEKPENIKTFVMSSRHHGVLVIPPLYANGWISLEDHTILVSLSNLVYDDAKDDDIRINPMVIGEKYWKVIPR